VLTECEQDAKGMPIYLDEQLRSIVDSLDSDEKSDDWHPANSAALKLWHCLEALRDIEIALSAAASQKNASKRKRHLKSFSVPLFSLASAVVQLCDQIVGDKSSHNFLDVGTPKEIATIKTEFLALVPFDWKGDLALIRNKLGGHIDSKIWPWEAREILSRRDVSDFGRWLHICIHVVADLTNLDIYSWSCRSVSDGYIRLMTTEPFLVTFRVDAEIKALAGIHIIKCSPRESVAQAAASVIRASQWMFQAGQPRITELKTRNGKDWNTFAESNVLWKR
jgi:hypothetical protein